MFGSQHMHVPRIVTLQTILFSRAMSRKSHKVQRTNLWTEEAMKNGTEEFERQNSDTGIAEHEMILRALAHAHDVPFKSLRCRIKGGITRAHQHQLGKTAMKNLASAGFPCARDDVRSLA